MYTLLLAINVAAALVMVIVILLQQGRGAEMGSSFGAGARGSLVGVAGSANLLSRLTSVLALVFFATALALGVVAPTPDGAGDSVLDLLAEEEAREQSESVPEPAASEVPVPAEAPADEE